LTIIIILLLIFLNFKKKIICLKCQKIKEITKEGNVLKAFWVSLFMLEVLESRNLPKEASYLFYVNCQNFINYFFTGEIKFEK
jgi:hypothetical protein